MQTRKLQNTKFILSVRPDPSIRRSYERHSGCTVVLSGLSVEALA